MTTVSYDDQKNRMPGIVCILSLKFAFALETVCTDATAPVELDGNHDLIGHAMVSGVAYLAPTVTR